MKINTRKRLLVLLFKDIFTVISSYYRVGQKQKVTEELLLLTLFCIIFTMRLNSAC